MTAGKVAVTDADRERAAAYEARWGVRLLDFVPLLIAEVRASAYAQGRADERDACAKVADDWLYDGVLPLAASLKREVAAAIRARAAQEGASDA